MDNNNTDMPQDIELSMIPYAINQPADPQLWDGSFCSISIFRMNEYLEGNTKNIICSLLRIAAFIKQCKLEGKTEKKSLKSLNLALLLRNLSQPSMRLDRTS